MRVVYLAFCTLPLVTACEKKETPTPPTPPEAAFTSPADLEAGVASSFVNQSRNANTYSWDFGDKTPIDETANPTHLYAQAGTYQVRLVAAGNSKTDTLRQQVVVQPYNVFKHATRQYAGRYSCRARYMSQSPSGVVRYSPLPDTILTIATDGAYLVWDNNKLSYNPSVKFEPNGNYYGFELNEGPALPLGSWYAYLPVSGDSAKFVDFSLEGHGTTSVTYTGVRLP